MKIFLSIICVLFLSADGIMASYISYRRRKKQKRNSERKVLLKELQKVEPEKELLELNKSSRKVIFPKAIMSRGGFAGRGSPFLTRYQYSTMESIDNSIERIIRK